MTDRLYHYRTLLGTAYNKQGEQLVGILRRKAKDILLPKLPIDVDARYERAIPPVVSTQTDALRANTERLRESVDAEREEYRQKAEQAVDGTVKFLNERISFRDGHVDSSAAAVREQSPLWRLKLNGFEHLSWTTFGYDAPDEVSNVAIETHKAWLREWNRNHPIADEQGYLRREWIPHSVSLRVLNWSRYDAWMGDRLDEHFRKSIRRYIFKNAQFLQENIEYGVGGNHLIENAVALVVAGVYVDRPQWRQRGISILERAADDQFLADGGHVERSPMYHLVVLQRYLTAVDLLCEFTTEVPESIREATSEAVSYCLKLTPPDGRIPLFNDAVFGEALSLSACRKYAQRIGVVRDVKEYTSLPNTGYYWLGGDTDRLLGVGSPTNVPHLPGHAHVHPAHFCLWVDGARVITDTGTYEYVATERRQYARSIESHNTVQVDGREPVYLSGSFFMDGNLRPTVKYDSSSDASVLSVKYDGGVTEDTYSHERQFRYEPGWWTIHDRIVGSESSCTSRFHLHPAVDVDQQTDGITVKDSQGTPILELHPFGTDDVEVGTAEYYPEFGTALNRTRVELKRYTDGAFGVVLKKPSVPVEAATVWERASE